MAYVKTISEQEATGDTRAMYEQALHDSGYVSNGTRLFGFRPRVMAAFEELLDSIRSNMDRRRYELVTVAAAQAMRNSYCALAHGKVLARDFFDAERVAAIATDFRNAGLPEVDVDIMMFAQKVVRDAAGVVESDLASLRKHGLSDTEIFDITTAAAVRCFISKTSDALGVQPDAKFAKLDPALREALTVGRPISGDGQGA